MAVASDTTSSLGGPVRMSCWPAPGDNPYLQLFYDALVPFGVTPTINCEVNDGWLRAHARDIDVIHLNWPEEIWRLRGAAWRGRLRGVVGLWRFLRLARRLGLRVIWTVHNITHHEGVDWVDRLGYRVLARHADLRICHGEAAVAGSLLEHGRGPIINMPHGNYKGAYPSPADRESTRRRLAIDLDARLLLLFGEVRIYKGFEAAIAAMASLDSRYVLLIAGRPHDAGLLERLRTAAAGDSRIRLLPEFQDRQQLSSLLNAADCILLPYTRVTGSGALLLALTEGRGVVCSDLPFFRETLAPEPTAGVLTPSDPQALVSAIQNFFSVPAKERHRAARRLANYYDWGKVVGPVAAWLTQPRVEDQPQ